MDTDPVGKRCVEEDAGKNERVLLVSRKPEGSAHSRSGQSPSFRMWSFPVMDMLWQGDDMKVTTLPKWLLTADAAPSHSGLRGQLSGFPRVNPVKLPLLFSCVSLQGRTQRAWGGGGLCFTSACGNYLKFFAMRKLSLLFFYLMTLLCMPAWNYGYLFYTLGYDPALRCSVACIVPIGSQTLSLGFCTSWACFSHCGVLF